MFGVRWTQRLLRRSSMPSTMLCVSRKLSRTVKIQMHRIRYKSSLQQLLRLNKASNLRPRRIIHRPSRLYPTAYNRLGRGQYRKLQLSAHRRTRQPNQWFLRSTPWRPTILVRILLVEATFPMCPPSLQTMLLRHFRPPTMQYRLFCQARRRWIR